MNYCYINATVLYVASKEAHHRTVHQLLNHLNYIGDPERKEYRRGLKIPGFDLIFARVADLQYRTLSEG